jgi:hypothetical protein
MIHEVDEALRSVIGERVAVADELEVAFDAPRGDWLTRRSQSPMVNAFLYDIREDTTRRDVAPVPITNDAGIVIGRRAPLRRFRLSYLVTAWTQRPEEEHLLLTRLLSTFLAFDEIPLEHLTGTLRTASLGHGQTGKGTIPTIVSVALPPPQDRSISDVWSALGGELKPSLDLVVVAPIEPGRHYEVGPPVLERPRLQGVPFDDDPDDVELERRRRAEHPVAAPADEPGEDERAATPEGWAAAEVRQVGQESARGRRFAIARKSHDD